MSEFGEQLKQRTQGFALRVIKMTNALPKTSAGRVLGSQVLRSGTSIGANYREAFRARSKAEFIAKVGECLKEAEETAYWLELLVQGELIKASRLQDLQDECSALIGVFVSVLKKGRARANS